jgi:hypothetical protein
MNSHTQKINNPAGRREKENHPFALATLFNQLEFFTIAVGE